ncbi:DNA-binding transcriptional regulator KdgR [Ferrimonas senticii]|uniref:DNA-binding transcriptional regulator KdgR n=1 Tax=Ferrimonas senticii TaxID=394566 RepID=UPI0003FABC43|nr:DNA-binding transcriptional regulator KdgR [Ferrimonas senticii]
MTESKNELVSSVQKVFGLLECLGAEKEWGITEIAQSLMMSKSTVYRFLQTMKSLGYVEQDEDNDKYTLTMKLFELGSKALEHRDLIQIAAKPMQQLSELLGETTHLAVLKQNTIVYVHKIDAVQTIGIYSRIGREAPLYCTGIGKCLMAYREAEVVEALMADVEFNRFTDNTHADFASYRNELELVKQQGFAEDKEEFEQHIRCLSAPIFDHLGNVVAGLSVSWLILRFNEADKAAYVEKIQAVAKRISLGLGCSTYPPVQ